jgi:photosystem II stability/assembly factor-like uncharacterized protein
MTNTPLLLLAALTLRWNVQVSNTTSSLRGLCAVSSQVVWASGTKGAFLTTTDGGQHWRAAVVPGAELLDFRDVEAFDANTAYLLASGDGANSRVYKTVDAGSHWELLLTNPDAKGFFDSLAFWDKSHAILVGDPVDKRFVVFTTADAGKSWQRQQTPTALPDEGAFAASGTSIVTLGTKDAWFATGGPAGARVFRTHDGGQTWKIGKAPLGGTKSGGIFSLAFVDRKHGLAVGGDYQNAKAKEHTLALTRDGGKTWQAPQGRPPLSYRSAVTALGGKLFIAVGTEGSDVSRDSGETWEHFSDTSLNAVANGGGAVWGVGGKGLIVKLAEWPNAKLPLQTKGTAIHRNSLLTFQPAIP